MCVSYLYLYRLCYLFSNVRAIQKINEAELESGTKKSWHDIYSHSAYIFIGEYCQIMYVILLELKSQAQ